MIINNISFNLNHQKSVLSSLNAAEGLPFTEILSSQQISEAMSGIDYRERIFTPDLTLWAFLSQVISAGQSQQAAVARVMAFFVAQGLTAPSANTSSYSQARSRLEEEFIANLAKDAGKQLGVNLPENWLWKGKKVKLMDGTTVSMPDTAENQSEYPQPDSQGEGIGFPIIRMVTIIELATGALLDLAMGPYSGKKTGEHALLRQLLPIFEAGDVALGDCYYASYFLLAMLKKRGVDAVFPIHSARKCDFKKGTRLNKKDHLVEWKKPKKPEWMSQEEYDELPDTLTIREVAIQNKQNGFRTKTRVLVTTFLDPKYVRKDDLSQLYNFRWFVEIAIKSIKETMNMDILRGKTPERVRKEIWTHMLAYNLIRKIMAQSAIIHNKIPRELSFKLALQIIEAFRHAGICCENDKDAYGNLLKAIAYKKIGNRPGRHEPRKVKRRPKSFPRLQKPREFYRKIK